MRIKQGYISKSISDFPFLSVCSLDDYNDNTAPALFIGCYRYEDICMLWQHKGLKLLLWTGMDAVDLKWDLPDDIIHITSHPNILKTLERFNIRQIPPIELRTKVKETDCGSYIYAYVPASSPDYHGKAIVDQLITEGYDILIGDGSIPQEDWRYGKCNEFYDPSFIGLCLSKYAGGGSTIIEMGLRGRKVVTNVLELPHTIRWSNIDDIKNAIQQERSKIGMFDIDLARAVKNALGTYEFLDTDYYK